MGSHLSCVLWPLEAVHGVPKSPQTHYRNPSTKTHYSALFFSTVRTPMFPKRKRACPDSGGNSRAQVTSRGSRCWLLPTSPLHLVTRVQEAACRPSFPAFSPVTAFAPTLMQVTQAHGTHEYLSPSDSQMAIPWHLGIKVLRFVETFTGHSHRVSHRNLI